jgi:urease accessory protein
MLTLRQRIASPSQVDGELVLPFHLRQRSRLLTQLAGGEAVGLMLERGTILRGGDCLSADDGRVVRVVAAEEDVMDAQASDPRVLARVAYHLGNRHASVEIGEGFARFATDTVLAKLVEGLGATVIAKRAPFEPEAGAYAAGHHHHSSEARHAGIIHDMSIERRRG